MKTLLRTGRASAAFTVLGIALAQPVATNQPLKASLAPATHTAKLQRLAPDKAKLSLIPKAAGENNLRLLDASGKEIRTAVSANGTLEAEVDPKQAYILSPPAVSGRRSLSTEPIQFPARYVTFGAGGVVNLGGLFLRPARAPLTWDDKLKAYATELTVGYEFQDGSERPLAAPKTVAFFAEGSNARIQSETVEVTRSGVAGYQRVKLSTTDLAGETFFTARAGPVDEVKGSVAIRRELATLKLTLPSLEIPGFGIGSGVLTVGLVARDGFPWNAEQATEVQLSSRRLRLPATVTIPAGKNSVEIEFRSSGLGEEGVTAQVARFSTTQAIRLIFPVAAVVAAIAGGAIGGMARSFRHRRDARKQKPLLARRLIEGILVGVIFVAAAWAGLVAIKLGAGVLGTPFGAFVLAALSGYVGCALLDRLTKRTFESLTPKTST